MTERSCDQNDCFSLSSVDYGWHPSQPWFVEAIRAATATLYATADNASSVGRRSGVHRNAISGQLSRKLKGAVSETDLHLTTSLGIDILLDLNDFAHIGGGYCIPRESRLVRLAPLWGRIAGGLPLPASEHPDTAVDIIYENTIGRIVKLLDDSQPPDRLDEYSEVYNWIRKTPEQRYLDLACRLSNKAQSEPSNRNVQFYDTGARRARTRKDRWQESLQRNYYVVARTTGVPSYYYVCIPKGRASWQWFEISNETARKWILLAEDAAGVTNSIRCEDAKSLFNIKIPNMLPKAWASALITCSVKALYSEGRWELSVPAETVNATQILLRSANIQMI